MPADVSVEFRRVSDRSYKAGTTIGTDDGTVAVVELVAENVKDFFFVLLFQIKKTTKPTKSVNKAPPRTPAITAPTLT